MRTKINLKIDEKKGWKRAAVCGLAVCGMLIAGCGEGLSGLQRETEQETVLQTASEENSLLTELESRIRRLEEALTEPPTEEATEPTPAPPASEPASTDPEANYRYELSEDGCATVTAYIGTEQSVTLPSALGGHPVVAVGENAFRNGSVKELILPDGIRKIDWFAFYGCFQLERVTLPASVVSIGYGAFDLTSSGLKFVCPEDSYAWRYAQSYGIPCRSAE